jgi:hypothetical protein
MSFYRLLANAGGVALMLAGATGAQAGAKFDASRWSFANDIVGQTSTATVAGGGNPIYIPPRPQYNSTVGILMNYGTFGTFSCSGTLLNSTAVVTAAHCVSSATRGMPISTTVFFTNSSNDGSVYANGAPDVDRRAVGTIVVNPLYTQQVVDQNDIAILRLTEAAPSYVKAARLSSLSDLTGLDHIVAGYGVRSNTGGADGTANGQGLGSGRLRYAGNRFDFRFGDADFAGYFDNAFGGADTNNVWISDFDNGTAFRDGSCNMGIFEGFSDPVFSSGKYCNTGIGAFEGIGGGGDSGGSYFIDGKLAAVHSFALWYRDDESSNRFGQLKGAVSVDLHRKFIISNAGAVPEPSSWALLIAGFGLTGAAMRRRRAFAG